MEHILGHSFSHFSLFHCLAFSEDNLHTLTITVGLGSKVK